MRAKWLNYRGEWDRRLDRSRTTPIWRSIRTHAGDRRPVGSRFIPRPCFRSYRRTHNEYADTVIGDGGLPRLSISGRIWVSTEGESPNGYLHQSAVNRSLNVLKARQRRAAIDVAAGGAASCL